MNIHILLSKGIFNCIMVIKIYIYLSKIYEMNFILNYINKFGQISQINVREV